MAAFAAAVVCTTTAWAAATGPDAWAATVTVRPRQTLSQLAAELHTTVAAIVEANHLADPNRVLAGQVLIVPGTGATGAAVNVATAAPSAITSAGAASAAPTTVVVGIGQTLTSIAAHYGVSVSAIVATNHLANPNLVLAGSLLVVPASPSAPDMQLLAYSVPTNVVPEPSSGDLPSGLLANPGRLALQPAFAAAASRYDVPLALLEALCWWESGWQNSVVSKTGALGVCQIEPATAAFVDQYLVSSPLDPGVATENIAMSAAYLADLLRASGDNVGLALAGYYQGLTAVRVFGMLPSTQTYVKGIEAYTDIFAG